MLTLTSSLGQCESLEVLSAKGNCLRTVPGALASLPKLRRVLLVDNHFEEVPLPLLLSASLVELDLSLNRITR